MVSIPRASRGRRQPPLFAGVRTPRLTCTCCPPTFAANRRYRLPKLRTPVRSWSPALVDVRRECVRASSAFSIPRAISRTVRLNDHPYPRSRVNSCIRAKLGGQASDLSQSISSRFDDGTMPVSRRPLDRRYVACHSVASRPSSTSSTKSPSTQAERRMVPSRTNPDFIAARCMARLSASVSACSR